MDTQGARLALGLECHPAGGAEGGVGGGKVPPPAVWSTDRKAVNQEQATAPSDGRSRPQRALATLTTVQSQAEPDFVVVPPQ